MTKRFISLILALILAMSLVLTSCSSSEDEDTVSDDDVTDLRNNIGVVIYGITGDDSTEDGIALVEEKISNYCYAKYKTKVDLRLFKESEYQTALDDMYDKFNELDEAAEQAKKEAAEISKSIKASVNKLSADEKADYEKKQREEARRLKDEEKERQAEINAAIRAGTDVATISEVQMDILFVKNKEDYDSYIKAGALTELTEMLRTTLRQVYDFEYPAFLTAATTSSGIFGIPCNKAITTNETYLVFNTELLEKYEVDLEKVRSITDLEDAFAAVKANEPGVTPILGDFDPEGLSYLQVGDVTFGHAVCVFGDQLLGGKLNFQYVDSSGKEQAYSSFSKTFNDESVYSRAFMDYCGLKYDYRSKGYLGDSGEYFVTVKELSDEEKAALEAEGKTLKLYKGALFTQEDALSGGLWAISARSAQKVERVAEILKLFVTDPDFHNLFTFGVEGVNYVENADDGTITVIDDSYSMNFYQCGNSFLGHVPDTMDPDYVEKGIQKNVNSRLSPTLSLEFDWDDPESKGAEILEYAAAWEEITPEKFNQLVYGVENYKEIVAELKGMTGADSDHNYSDFNSSAFSTIFKSNYGRVLTLDTLLHPDVKE